MAKTKCGRNLLIFLAALASSLSAQTFDNSGNNLLNGTYYFREVAYTANVDVALYGTITFSGNGSYSMNAVTFDDSSGQQNQFNSSGTYTISSSGYGFISNPLMNDLLSTTVAKTYGLVSNGIFVGSSTETGINDVFIAAPLTSQATGTLNGGYTLAYVDPLGDFNGGVAFDAQLTFNANGAGGIGNVALSAYSTGTATQNIGSVNYTFSNGAFVVNFPNNNNNFITGSEYLYSTPDGSFVFGGSPFNLDMIVGVKNSSGSSFNGLYYQAGMDEDLSQNSFDTYYGSFNVASGVVVGQQRLLFFGVNAEDETYSDFSTVSSSGTYTGDQLTEENYIGGNGGAIRIGYGIGPVIGLSVAVAAPNLSGSGVYLNPTAVVNAASYAPFTAGISPGELILLGGTNLGPSSLQVAQNVPFPTSLGGVQVLINNIQAPIYYVSSTTVAAIVPYEVSSAAGSTATIQVKNNGQVSNVVTDFVFPTTPGVFTNPANGIGDAAALHQDGVTLVTANNPAEVGETISVFLTGLGAVSPTINDGAAGPSNPLSNTVDQISATVDFTAATVTFAGLAPGFAGLYQVNLTIPSGATTNSDDYLEILGGSSSSPDSDNFEAGIPIGSGVFSADRTNAKRSQTQRHKAPTGKVRRPQGHLGEQKSARPL